MSTGFVLSVHDVMPDTLAPIGRILARLEQLGLPPATLLVVPGCRWLADDLAQLAHWQQQGYALAAHGWHHRAGSIRGMHHRLHAALLSRHAAEHLSLSGEAIAALMQCAHDWFPRNGLAAPDLYVPPAWALGALPRPALRALPYTSVETLSGIIDTASGRLRPMPLVGFEADTAARAVTLRAFNRSQRLLARGSGLPLRIGIHPQDFRLRLADDLHRMLVQFAVDSGTQPAASPVCDGA